MDQAEQEASEGGMGSCQQDIDAFKTPGEKSNLVHLMGPRKLNLGCGVAPEPIWNGWDNTDFNPRSSANFLFDMREENWPIKPESYNTIMAHLVLHLFNGRELFQIIANIWESLKSEGHLIGEVPYGMTGNPLHLRYWDETTPIHLTKGAYFKSELPTTLCDQMMPLREWEVPFVGLRKGEDSVAKSMLFVMKKV